MKTWIKSTIACVVLFASASGVSAATATADTPRVDNVLQSYYGVTNALAGNDLAAAKSAALDLQQAAADDDARSPARLAAGRIAAASDLAEARRGLEDLTADVRRLIASAGTLGDGPVFVVHCPMAFDGKGADWLQRDKAVTNPYFGPSMLKCGTVTETLGEASTSSE